MEGALPAMASHCTERVVAVKCGFDVWERREREREKGIRVASFNSSWLNPTHLTSTVKSWFSKIELNRAPLDAFFPHPTATNSTSKSAFPPERRQIDPGQGLIFMGGLHSSFTKIVGPYSFKLTSKHVIVLLN